MKKLVLAAIGIVAVVAGFGVLSPSTTHADVTAVYVINTNVANAVQGAAVDLTTAAGRTTAAANLAAMQTASGGQVGIGTPTTGGITLILVKTDGTAGNVQLNGRGLVCSPVCDNTASGTLGTDAFAEFTVTGLGSPAKAAGSTLTVTAQQASTSTTVDSGTLTIVGPATDFALAASKTTIQEKTAAAGCTPTADTTSPTITGLTATYHDIFGTDLVGYMPAFGSSTAAKLAIGSSTGALTNAGPTQVTTMVQADGTTIAAADVACGVAAGTANATATSGATELTGQTAAVTRTVAITVTGVPSAIALTASPASIDCNGTSTSTVTAKVTDSAGNNVVDNTPVTFSVVALGTANPITTKTTAGTATSTVTPLSANAAGVTVTVSSGSVSASILVSCNLPTPTVPAGGPGAGTATPLTGVIGPPNTGTGGYLGQDGSDGFPMWAILALAAGSLVLLGGGVVARRRR